MFSLSSKLLVSLMFLFSLATFVKADPIKIISGRTTNNATGISGTPNTSVSFFSETPVTTATDPRWFYANGATANPIVDIFKLAPNGVGSYAYRTSLGSNSILNGISYLDLVLNTDVSYMIFTPTQTFKLPTVATSAPFTVEFPFAMQGYLAGSFYPNGINSSGSRETINPISIFGTGTARLTFIYLSSQSAWSLSNFDYAFSSTPEPTPEPATILLLGTGLLGIAGYAKRKRKQKQTE